MHHLQRSPQTSEQTSLQWLKSSLTASLALIACLALGSSSVLAAEDASDKIPLAELQRFTTVVEQIKNAYVKSVDDSELFENALKGMLGGLDPHSSYLDEEEFSDLKAATTGKFGGLGIEVIADEGFIRVITPIDDTPAQRAGILAGDIIVRLDDTPVKGLTIRKAVEIMRGEKGTSIILTIIRQGEAKPLQISVTRDQINVKSIKSKMLEDQYGYIRITQFQSNSGDELIKSLQSLKKDSGGKMKGLVLDLRNNPGGVLESAVQISDTFLDREKLKHDGLIVYTKGRFPASQLKEKAHAGDMLSGAPIVVLVNEGSASAAEIVAGALQDHRRAVIVGAQTFGKGSVQTVLPLKDNRGLKLTTALYYTPAGRSIQATGIKPDVLVPNIRIPKSNEKEQSSLWVREEDLENHLDNGMAKGKIDRLSDDSKDAKTGEAGARSGAGSGSIHKDAKDLKNLKEQDKGKGKDKLDALKDKKDGKDSDEPLMNSDYQLYEALNILKGLSLLSPGKETTK